MAVTLNPFTGELQLINAAGGGGGIGGGGAVNQLSYFTGAFTIGGNAAFMVDVPGLALYLGDMAMTALASGVINDNEPTPVTIFSIPHADFKHAIIEYSIERGANFRTGVAMMSTDGTTATLTDTLTEVPGSTGVTLLAEASGAVVEIRYTSTNTGDAGTIKYHVRKWL